MMKYARQTIKICSLLFVLCGASALVCSAPDVMYLETPRLQLRHFSMDDASALLPIFGDHDVARYSGGVKSLEQITEMLETKFLKSYEKHGFGRYAVIEKATERLIGIAGFSMRKIDDKELVDFGIGFVKDAWGKGFATEVVRALRRYATTKLGIASVIAIINPANTGSIRIAEKLGMRFWKETMLNGKLVLIYQAT